MLFNSLHYLLFLPLVTAAFFLMPPKRRWALLLAASYYFYMCWKMEYIVLIIISTLIDYFAGLKMGQIDNRRGRRKYLLLSIFSNLGLLFAFKYFNFFSDSARQVFAHFNIIYDMPILHVLLPVGISFYTFQTLSYSIDVYRGRQEAERHLGIFALYVSFFPQLVAGPIERSTNLLPQFYNVNHFEYERVRRGLLRIMWGLFKKVVIADRVAVVVNLVYNNPESHTGIEFFVATFFFAYQIYCDFSGYSDIAIGSAEILGFNLMRNFDRPYYAKSIAEFWKRWHISLSTWFRDYLYITMGGSRRGKLRWYFNLFFTFLVSGLWHGANWTFVVWGALNGFYLIGETLTASWKARIMNRLGIRESQWRFKISSVLVTFSLTCFAWVFFRANSMSDALYILRHLGDGLGQFLSGLASGDWAVVRGTMKGLGLSREDLWIAVGSIAFLELVQFFTRGKTSLEVLKIRTPALRWGFYYLLLAVVVFLGAFNQSQQFIYFQF